MSLGIDDPVTRDAFRSDSDYYIGLAQQISDMMVAVLIVSLLKFKKKTNMFFITLLYIT